MTVSDADLGGEAYMLRRLKRYTDGELDLSGVPNLVMVIESRRDVPRVTRQASTREPFAPLTCQCGEFTIPSTDDAEVLTRAWAQMDVRDHHLGRPCGTGLIDIWASANPTQQGEEVASGRREEERVDRDGSAREGHDGHGADDQRRVSRW